MFYWDGRYGLLQHFKALQNYLRYLDTSKTQILTLCFRLLRRIHVRNNKPFPVSHRLTALLLVVIDAQDIQLILRLFTWDIARVPP